MMSLFSSHCGSFCLKVVGKSAIVSAIALFSIFAGKSGTNAQLVPDGTLGGESSILNGDRIEGGAIRDINLFHSFLEFNIGDLQRVDFANPTGIENIFSRVTGNNPSHILGTLGVDGGANLFFLNPNGVIFGENARLDMQGSFAVSTGESFVFGNGSEYSAIAPQMPPLLTVGVPLGLQYGQGRGNISNAGNLAVEAGQSMLLHGAEVSGMGLLSAPEGMVTILANNIFVGNIDTSALVGANAAAGGKITLNATGDITTGNLSSYSVAGSLLGNANAGAGGVVNLTANGSIKTGNIDTSSTAGSFFGNAISQDGGKVILDAGGGIVTREISSKTTAISQRGNATAGSAGYVTLLANGDINPSLISANVNAVSLDRLNTASVEQILSGNIPGISSGDAGDIEIRSRNGGINIHRDILSIGGYQIDSNLIPEALRSKFLHTLATGDGGDITLEANDAIAVGMGAGIHSRGSRGGAIAIDSNTNITINEGGVRSDSFSNVEPAGNIVMNTPSLDMKESDVRSQTNFAGGRAGDVIVNVNNLRITNSKGIRSETRSSGRSGDVTINVRDSIELHNGDIQASSTVFDGDAGNVTVNTRQLLATRGTDIAANARGAGRVGNVTVNASERVELSGVRIVFEQDERRLEATAIGASSWGDSGGGDAGTVTVNTQHLIVRDGAIVATMAVFPEGEGQGGDLVINAIESVELSGTSSDGSIASGLYGDNFSSGDAGNVRVNTRRLDVLDGAVISASTVSEGQGGNIIINTSESINLNGTTSDGRASGVFALSGLPGFSSPTLRFLQARLQEDVGTIFAVEDVLTALSVISSTSGQGGDIRINTGQLNIENGASVGVSSEFEGNAGDIHIDANMIFLNDRGAIASETASGEGGNINLTVGDLLLLRRNSRISTTAGTAQAGGNGGNITISAPFIVAVPGENSDITANAFSGRGGNINITANAIYGLKIQPQLTSRSDITASSEVGLNGTIVLNTLGIDVTRGLTELPQDVPEPELLNACEEARGNSGIASSLIDSGRMGIPIAPDQAIAPDNIQIPLATMGESAETPEIDAAIAWVELGNGEMMLVSASSFSTLRSRCL